MIFLYLITYLFLFLTYLFLQLNSNASIKKNPLKEHRCKFKIDKTTFQKVLSLQCILKSSFCSKDIEIFVLIFWSYRKNGFSRKITLISNFMTSQLDSNPIPIKANRQWNLVSQQNITKETSFFKNHAENESGRLLPDVR